MNEYECDFKRFFNELFNNNIYRDLSLPMGALNIERSLKYIEQFNEWEERKFHYGTHYSNPAGIFHYLLRIEPYTQQHCQLQNGKFDHSDRLFHNLNEMWLHQSKKSFHAVRELSPEFFYLSQIFINGSNYNFGKREHDGKYVNNVILPNWCWNNSEIFIELHRCALESQYVSNNLNKWIDLIFGYKQNGKNAKESQNLFHPLTYKQNFNIDSFKDDILKQAAIEQVRSFGNCPKQIFNKPHPKKINIYGNNNKYNKYPICNIIYNNKINNKLYQLSVKIYNNKLNKFIDIKYIKIDNNNNNDNNNKNIFIGDIYCNKLKNSEKYIALLGYQKYINTPIIDFILRYNIYDNSIRIRKINNNNNDNNNKKKEHILYNLHTNIINCISVSSDGQTIITGGNDGMVKIWEIKFSCSCFDNNNHNEIKIESNISIKFKLISSISAHLKGINNLVFSQKYNIFITVCLNKAIVWDFINLKCIHILKFKQNIGAISLCNHRFVISFGCNFSIYNIYGDKIASFEPKLKCDDDDDDDDDDDNITNLYLPDQNGIILFPTKIELSEYYTSCHIFSGHKNGMIRIWSLIYKPEISKFCLIRISKLNGHTTKITSINITGNGNILLSGDQNGKLIKWGLSNESLKAFYFNLSSNKISSNNHDDDRRNTTNQSYGIQEKGDTAIKRRGKKDEIKSKYQAFELHFNNVCLIQDKIEKIKREEMKKNNKKKIKENYYKLENELKSSLEILKRSKSELEKAKLSQPRIFCKLTVYLESFWQINCEMIKENDNVNFKIINDNKDIGCYNNFGKIVGIINDKQKMSLIILIDQGILFEGIIGKKINNFKIEIKVIGYLINSIIDKNILINKLKSIGIHLNKENQIDFNP